MRHKGERGRGNPVRREVRTDGKRGSEPVQLRRGSWGRGEAGRGAERAGGAGRRAEGGLRVRPTTLVSAL